MFVCGSTFIIFNFTFSQMQLLINFSSIEIDFLAILFSFYGESFKCNCTLENAQLSYCCQDGGGIIK